MRQQQQNNRYSTVRCNDGSPFLYPTPEVAVMVWLASLPGQAEPWKPDWDTCVMSILQPACYPAHHILFSLAHHPNFLCPCDLLGHSVEVYPWTKQSTWAPFRQSRKRRLEHDRRLIIKENNINAPQDGSFSNNLKISRPTQFFGRSSRAVVTGFESYVVPLQPPPLGTPLARHFCSATRAYFWGTAMCSTQSHNFRVLFSTPTPGKRVAPEQQHKTLRNFDR